ncbi:WG repeat-containing protein [Moraxella lacunata]|nr:WG repeat-containing protein [Moraxella lacunata]
MKTLIKPLMLALSLLPLSALGCEMPEMSEYDTVSCLVDDLAKVAKNNKWGFAHKNGKQIIPIQYDDVLDFKEGLVGVSQNGKWGYIDKTGKMIIPIQYDFAFNFL